MMKANLALLVIILISGCTIIPGKKPAEPSFYILNPLDLPPGYEVTQEKMLMNETLGVKGFYVRMKIEKESGSGGTIDWVNIGYAIMDDQEGEANLEAIKATVPSDFVQLEAPDIGDTNYFYANPDHSAKSGRYIFYYTKDDYQLLFMISAEGVTLEEILSLLDIIDKRIN